ncbi:MAG: DnaJ domain-containing protein [bacterium]|nr:DnaJ domain-containing protein [bacterium]
MTQRRKRYSLPPLRATLSKPRECDRDGCAEPGEFRAPKSTALRDYHWFCVDHVRAYNASWNFYQGMKVDEVEAHWVSDMTWQRPSWAFGASTPFYRRFESILRNESIFAELNREDKGGPEDPKSDQKSYFPPYSEEAVALKLFALGLPLSKETLRKRYKELVKQYHPDHHQGNKDYEERLKSVTQAYGILKKIVA